MSSFFRVILFLSSLAILILAQSGDAFVPALPTKTKQKPPHVSHLPEFKFSFYDRTHSSPSTMMATEPDAEKSKSSGGLPFWLDPGTRGGAVVLSTILFVLPLIGYSVVTNFFGVDGVEAGKYIGVGFTAIATIVWVFTYIFRVATKDMTYAKQLKDYENAVIAKRLEELDDDEIQALVEEIERDEF